MRPATETQKPRTTKGSNRYAMMPAIVGVVYCHWLREERKHCPLKFSARRGIIASACGHAGLIFGAASWEGIGCTAAGWGIGGAFLVAHVRREAAYAVLV